MEKNVFVLTGYSNNGKTSLLKPIQWQLQNRYPNKNIVIINEVVKNLFFTNDIMVQLRFISNPFDNEENNDNNNNEFISDLYKRQNVITSCFLTQLDDIKNMYKANPNTLFICDRCILDALIFLAIGSEKGKYSLDMDSLFYAVDEIKKEKSINVFNFNYFFINSPSNPACISKGLEKRERKYTISKDNYYKNALSFKQLYEAFDIPYFKEFESPADNTYTLYNILDNIVSIIKKRRII